MIAWEHNGFELKGFMRIILISLISDEIPR